jgi:O-antigen/teichoic acid export membrane protein/O-antigen ligase
VVFIAIMLGLCAILCAFCVFLARRGLDPYVVAACAAVGVLVDFYHLIPFPDDVPVPYFAPLMAITYVAYKTLATSHNRLILLARRVPQPALWTTLILVGLPSMLIGRPLSESAAYYLALIVAPLIMCALGAFAARDTTQLKLILAGVAGLGAVIAMHTVLESQFGVFLFANDSANFYFNARSTFSNTSPSVLRAGSFLLNPDANGTAMAVMLFFPVALLLHTTSRWMKTIYAAETLLIAIALLHTYSAGAIIALGGGLATFITLTSTRRARLIVLGACAIIALVLFILFPSQLYLLYQHAAAPRQLGLRAALWESSLSVIAAHPVLGIGFSRTAYQQISFQFALPIQTRPEPTPHNSFLELAAFGGIALAVIFIIVLLASLVSLARTYRLAWSRERLLIASVIGAVITLTINSLEGAAWTNRAVAWIVWALVGAAASPLLAQALLAIKRTSEAETQLMETPFRPPQNPNVPSMQLHAKGGNLPLADAPGNQLRKIAAGVSGPMFSPDGEMTPETALLPIDQQPTMLLAALPGQGVLDVSLPVDQIPTVVLPVVPSGVESAFAQSQSTAKVATPKGLLKSSSAFALGAFASPLIAILLTPFLTSHLTAGDYGTLTLCYALISLLAPITQLGTTSAFFRAFNLDFAKKRERQDVLATTLVLISVVTVPASLLLVFTSGAVSSALFGDAAPSALISLTAYILLLQNISTLAYAWLRAENRPLAMSLVTIGNLLVTLLATLYFVGVLQTGINGALISTACGYAVVDLCVIPFILLRAGVNARWDIAISMLAFGAPQVPGSIAFWLLQLSDRYILGWLGTREQVAHYSVAYTLGWAVVTIVISPFVLAWMPLMYKIAKRDDASVVFQTVFRWYASALLLATFALTLAGGVALEVFFPPSYRSAADVIPLISASAVLYGVYLVMIVGVNVQRKTWVATGLMMIASVLNIGANVVLIPAYGATGAATSTLLAYLALATLAYFVNQRIYPLPFQVNRFMVGAALGYALFLALNPAAALLGSEWIWSLRVLALVLYAAGLLILIYVRTVPSNLSPARRPAPSVAGASAL